MTGRMLRRDLVRTRAVNTALFLFILLSAMLISLAAALIAELTGAMDTLFADSAAPHFTQMHSGELDQDEIDAFAAANPLVAGQQTVEMLNVPGRSVTLGGNSSTEAASVMEIAFVTQNQDFDFLLDLSGGIARVSDGQVGVPVYFQQRDNLRLGDVVRVDCGGLPLELTISCFVRDAQMNPSVVTSKRFLVSDRDWQVIRETVASSEYLIEFRLTDPALAGEFERQYASSGLPQSDTAITDSLYRLLAALSDGLVAAVMILIGLLLVLISMLCLRYTILGALEEDTREIGVMKAIGLSGRDTRSLYMSKYALLAGAACLLGFAVSLPLRRVLTGNIALYMGAAAGRGQVFLLPLLAATGVFLLILFLVRLVLRRLGRLSAVQALRVGAVGDLPQGRRRSLRGSRLGQINAQLALQDVLLRPKSYALLGFVFTACAFLAITPSNLYSTVASPRFITYMGAGSSDLRIDLLRAGELQGEYGQVASHLAADPQVERFAPFVTATFQAESPEGGWTALKVETGDFSVFPLEYAAGAAPRTDSEIALSAMNADELEKGVGDSLTVLVRGEERSLTVSGIYQDVTNGGKTAKALLPVDGEDILWYVLSVDLADGADVSAKKDEYAALFPWARVLDMEDYLAQTLGAVTSQVRLAAVCGLAAALAVSVLVTAMFLRMMLAKDASQTAILTCLGFSRRDLRIQHLLRALLVLVAGILLGTLAAAALGQPLAGLLLSSMGASSIRFTVNPLVSYLLCPGLLTVGVALTALACSRSAHRLVNLRAIAD